MVIPQLETLTTQTSEPREDTVPRKSEKKEKVQMPSFPQRIHFVKNRSYSSVELDLIPWNERRVLGQCLPFVHLLDVKCRILVCYLMTSSPILTWGNILLLDFFLFSCSKDSDVNIGIIAILVHFEKNSSNRYFLESIFPLLPLDIYQLPQ